MRHHGFPIDGIRPSRHLACTLQASPPIGSAPPSGSLWSCFRSRHVGPDVHGDRPRGRCRPCTLRGDFAVSDVKRVERRRSGLVAVGAAALAVAALVVWFATGTIVPPVFATRTPASMPAGRAPSKTVARGTEPLVQPN